MEYLFKFIHNIVMLAYFHINLQRLRRSISNYCLQDKCLYHCICTHPSISHHHIHSRKKDKLYRPNNIMKHKLNILYLMDHYIIHNCYDINNIIIKIHNIFKGSVVSILDRIKINLLDIMQHILFLI